MKKASIILLITFLFSGTPAQAQGVAEITDEKGRIFLADRNGELWRCYAAGTGSLPLQCRRAGGEDWTPIEAEEIRSYFVKDKEGTKHPVRY